MAFTKYANAQLVSPGINFKGWDEVRQRAGTTVPAFNQREATKVVLQKYDPKEFLLSHCFPPGHKVLLADGTERAIETIQVGDLVLTHLGNIRPVTRVMVRDVDEDLVVISSASLPDLASTAEHPFYVIRENAASCVAFPSYIGNVKCTYGGKKICADRGCSTNGSNPVWVDAQDVRIGDRTYTPTLHEVRIAADLNPNRLRVLGYYVAEGRVDKDAHRGLPYMIRFSIHENEIPTLGAEISRLMRQEFDIQTHSVIRDRSKPNKGVTLSFHSFEAAPWFLKHAGCGSRTKKLSLDVMLSPIPWQRQLMGSWINGDGCYDKQGIRLATSSDDLASQAVVLLDRAEIHSISRRILPAVKTRKSGPFDRIRPFDGWHVCISNSYVELLTPVVRWLVRGNQTKKLSTKGRYRYAASTLSTVETVSRRAYKGPVFNLSVEGDESYVIHRQTVHNCTIIASVDAEKGPGTLGAQMVDNFQINRKYSDYHVTAPTLKYINNNNDCWERKLLLAAFRTFTGGENYVEHIQIPELSKGKIIDAAARDIGESIYVDILVATNRKHKPLIEAITAGSLSTLSMGCFLPGTPVTMADGRRLPIEEVAPGDMVLTHKGRAREVINKQIRGGVWSMRRISVTGVADPIEATGTHPFYVVRPAKVCACGCGETLITKDTDPVRRMTKRFKRGHDKRVLHPNGTYSLDDRRDRQAKLEDLQSLNVEKVRADELQVGDYVIFPKLDAETVSDPGSAKARLLGYFLAEGSFLKTKGSPSEVQFNFSIDEKQSFVKETVRLLTEAFPGCAPWVQDREDRNTSTVHVTGQELVAWFHVHGGEYSHLKRLSPEVMLWSVESQRHLIGAWLNGDGHKHAKGHSVGTTTSYDLACQLHLLSVRCGIPVRMDCVFGGKVVTVAQAVVGGVSQRHVETGKLAAFNLYYPRSSASNLSSVSAKAPTASTRDRNLRTLDGNVIFPITQIDEFAYEGFVHDMEVDEDHSYQVQGVAASNCQVQFTICTKCGNVADDETQLCPHVKYLKGNDFFDEFGQKRKIAELCGHIEDEPGSVKFIEASWVANPAFRGAVLRSILSAEDIKNLGGLDGQMTSAFSQPARVAEQGALQKAARMQAITGMPAYVRNVLGQEFGMDDPEPKPEAKKPEAKPPAPGAPNPSMEAPASPKKEDADPTQKMVDELAQSMREKALKKLQDEMGADEASAIKNLHENQNDNLVKAAMSFPEWRSIAKTVVGSTGMRPKAARKILAGLVLYKSGGWQGVIKTGVFSGRDLLSVARMLDLLTLRSISAGESRVYRTVLAVGGMAPFQDIRSYLSACRQVVGRDLTSDEQNSLIDKGRLFALGS